MWLISCTWDQQLRDRLEPVLTEFEIEALWQIGSRSRNDFTAESDWDFMVIFRRFSTKRHEHFEQRIKEVFKQGASALTVFHVITVLPCEQGAAVIRDAIPLWKVT